MTNAPDLGEVLAGSLRDIWPALRSWLRWGIAAVIGASAAGIWVVRLTPPAGLRLHGKDLYAFVAGISMGLVIMVAAQYFALASAVRTVRPEFRMTVGTFFGSFGYSIVVGLIVIFGCLLFVVPGLYALVKLGLAPYVYLLGERGDDPIREARALTRGRFWLTTALFAVLCVVSEATAYASGTGAEMLMLFSPATIVVVIPLNVAVLIVVAQFQFNAYVRWVYALGTSSTLSNTGTALPPTVTL